ncbi:FecR family protein [Niabella aurantiaca]|uniref:FecR family protein n=1 Tax=Niabella aurantiaca TaxID=379900 RepID=UPI00036DCF70|nr:FecR family protein [Niabella aurantiaca]
MKPGKDLIERFFKNQCTDAEAVAVDRFFRENPGELEQYLPVKAWLTSPEKQLSTTVSDRILQHIREKYRKKKPVSIAEVLRYTAAAAVIGLLVWTGLKRLMDTSARGKDAMAHTSVAGVLKMIENKTGNAMRIDLPDRSVVTLYPNSRLQYLPSFEKNSRALYLKGKAGFKVHKDKTRPFTVCASGIATTALGTQFLVSVLDDRRVSVILKEGIVKVSPQHSKDEHMHVVLHPGDQLIVNNRQFRNYFLTHPAASIPAVKKNEKKPVLPAPGDTLTKKGTRLVFKNQPLKEVFRQIEEKFGVTIDHKNAPGIGEKLFTGVFLESDDLKFICDLICRLHDLHYSIEAHTVIVRPN